MLGAGDDGSLRSGGRTGHITKPAAGGIPPVRGTVATLHPCQAAAERFAEAFVPRTGLGVFFRNQVIKTFRVPTIAKIAIGRDIRDQLELPRYHL